MKRKQGAQSALKGRNGIEGFRIGQGKQRRWEMEIEIVEIVGKPQNGVPSLGKET